MDEFYRIKRWRPRVLGREAHIITVNQDKYRFGDLNGSMARPRLRSNPALRFARRGHRTDFLQRPGHAGIPDSELIPAVRTDGMRWVRQGPSHDNASPALAAYRASQLPPGFHLTVAGAQILGGASVPASHLVYSDGLATVSVFVEAQRVEVQGAGVGSDAAVRSPSEPPMEGLARVGSGLA